MSLTGIEQFNSSLTQILSLKLAELAKLTDILLMVLKVYKSTEQSGFPITMNDKQRFSVAVDLTLTSSISAFFFFIFFYQFHDTLSHNSPDKI